MDIDDLKNDNLFMVDVPTPVMEYMREHQCNQHNYCGYVCWVKGELVLRTFAFKTNRDGLMYTEVERKTPSLEMAVRKNIYLTAMSGYRPVYRAMTCCNGNCYGYTYYYFDAADFGLWMCDKPMGLSTIIVNPQDIFKKKYMYCGYPGGWNLIEYLRMYEKNPMVEYFGKIGIRPTATLMNKAKKDKQFIRFLMDIADEAKYYGPKAVIYAYEHHMSLEEAENFLLKKRDAERLTSALENIKGMDRIKVAEYIHREDVGLCNYRDYWHAINYLGLDVYDTKNAFPHDFKRMHDLRINEYASKKAENYAKAMRKLTKRFYIVANQYKPYEVQEDDYTMCIPTKPTDLKREGRLLHHCVGRMGYDKKMADGKSLIAFLRKSGEPYKPFVTVEYDTKTWKVLQCYAAHDSRPADDVIAFAERFGLKIKKEVKQ